MTKVKSEKYNSGVTETESDILFSKTIKAGQRIYYIDVKINKRGDMYLSITESKKTVSGSQEMPQVSYEKHKIFLFQEDFQKFQDSLKEGMNFVLENQGEASPRPQQDSEIEIDMEF